MENLPTCFLSHDIISSNFILISFLKLLKSTMICRLLNSLFYKFSKCRLKGLVGFRKFMEKILKFSFIKNNIFRAVVYI